MQASSLQALDIFDLWHCNVVAYEHHLMVHLAYTIMCFKFFHSYA